MSDKYVRTIVEALRSIQKDLEDAQGSAERWESEAQRCVEVVKERDAEIDGLKSDLAAASERVEKVEAQLREALTRPTLTVENSSERPAEVEVERRLGTETISIDSGASITLKHADGIDIQEPGS